MRLKNFKGIESLDVDFGETTEVSGKNGSGKTTIADAVSWCLFGKNSVGETSFGLKRRDKDGNVIPHLEHYVMLTLMIGNEEVSLKREVVEKWEKRRGEEMSVMTGNTMGYYINGEKKTKTDYNNYLASHFDADVFRLLTVPSHFCEMAWKDQLSLLLTMVGNISEDVLKESHKEILSEIKECGVTRYSSHLKYQIKKIKEELVTIPPKLTAYRDMLPEVAVSSVDYDQLVKDYEFAVSAVAQYEAGVNKTTYQKIADLEQEILRHESKIRRKVADVTEKHEADVRTAKSLLDEQIRLLQNLTEKASSLNGVIDRCNEESRNLERKINSVKEEGSQIFNSHYIVTDELFTCPACGSPLSESQVREIVAEERRKFNESKAQMQKDLLEELNKYKRDLEEAQTIKADAIQSLHETNEALQKVAMLKIEHSKALSKVESEKVTSYEEAIEKDAKHRELTAKLLELEESNEVSDDSVIKELEATRDRLASELESARKENLIKEQAMKIQSAMDDLKRLQTDLNTQLSGYERKEDLLKRYLKDRDKLIEDKVNTLFKVVKFKLSKTNNDGESEQWCVATHNGVEYNDLNKAMKIAVGIDIINALSRYYQITAPIIIDNAECCNTLPEVLGQKIAMYVTETNLTIK